MLLIEPPAARTIGAARHLSFSNDGRLYVLDVESKFLTGPLESPHTKLFLAPAFDPTGRRFYAGGVNFEGGVYSWPVGPVTSVAISPDGYRGGRRRRMGAVAVWDVDE